MPFTDLGAQMCIGKEKPSEPGGDAGKEIKGKVSFRTKPEVF